MTKGRELAWMLIILFLAPMFSGCTDIVNSNSPPTPKMSVEPSGLKKAGDSILFSAIGTSDPDADSMSFVWTFGDGNTGSGLTTNHIYSQAGEYVVRLAVSDGTHEVTVSKTITVSEENTFAPKAIISTSRDDNCEGDESRSGDWIIIWMCEEKETDDREVSETVTVSLDASESCAGFNDAKGTCSNEDYIVSWNWDLDVYVDSDGDGETDNDVDATGEQFSWEDRNPGATKIKLTVIDNNDLEDSKEVTVYINYQGKWQDFIIDRRIQEPITMTWEYPVTYDDNIDRIRYIRIYLSYPKEDDDQPGGGITGGGGVGGTTNNKLDFYVYNSTEYEVMNSTGIDNENRDMGDCDTGNDYCVIQIVGGSTVRGYLPGQWTVDLENAETHNTKVNHFIIELEYK